MKRVFALADCNNFYASCERAFVPSLRDRPVVVLSNNDGCVIARSQEAKDLGVAMGSPYFKCADMLKRMGVAVFSSNYALYGDMSARVMSVLGRFAPDIEVYSIDEAFLDFSGLGKNSGRLAGELRNTVLQWTGIPVSIGIGPTKTLAKAANRLAKKNPGCVGVLDLCDNSLAETMLAGLPVEDVWGIGPRHSKLLRSRGVGSALDFRNLPGHWVKSRMGVTGLQTMLELRGRACFTFEDAPPPKKTIVSSRSFGRPVTGISEMREALASYATRAGEKLRRQGSVASALLVFVQTNRFDRGVAQYAASQTTALSPATCRTEKVIKGAHKVLEHIFKPGHKYKKAGLMLYGLEPEKSRQLNLLEPFPDGPGGGPLMLAVDAANCRWGKNTVRYAASGLDCPWKMRREMRSPLFTTSWSELPEVR